MPTAKDELVRFCLLSSVRGVPRILRCRSTAWKLIWLVSVCSFLSVSLVLIGRLINTYRMYQTVLEVSTEHYSSLVPFPSVTVCNLQPFSTSMIKRFVSDSNGTTDMRLLNTLERLKQHSNFSSSFKALTEKSFLYQNWGIDTVRQIGLAFHDFVLNGTCNFTFVRESKLQQRQCSQASDVRVIPNPQFFTCFMISPKPDVSNTTQSLEMDLYLDTEQLFSCQEANECNDALFDLDDSIGAHVLVHPANTYPRISHLGIHVLPGTKSVVEVVEARSLEKYGDSPKQTCRDMRELGIYIGDSPPASSRFAYESLTCRQLEVQDSIRKHCNCVDPDFPLRAQQREVPFCGRVTDQGLESSAFFRNYDCASRQELDPRNLISEESADTCPTSCSSLSFKTTAYQSLWPPKANELDFWRLRIRDSPVLAEKFSAYAAADRLVAQGNLTAASQLLNGESGALIRENFLRLRVFRPDFARTVTREKLQITLEALISQIGGSFSLWGGLTVITTVELLEFAYYLLKRLLLGSGDDAQQQQQQQQQQGQQQTHEQMQQMQQMRQLQQQKLEDSE